MVKKSYHLIKVLVSYDFFLYVVDLLLQVSSIGRILVKGKSNVRTEMEAVLKQSLEKDYTQLMELLLIQQVARFVAKTRFNITATLGHLEIISSLLEIIPSLYMLCF